MHGVKRNVNIELLRCLLMYFIVLFHVWFGAPIDHNQWWSFFFCGLLIWHVDAFVAISGWYGIRFTWQKFARVWGCVLFYSLLKFILTLIENGAHLSDFRINGGWFGSSYLVLMLAAPFINAAVSGLQLKGRNCLVLAWALLTLPFVLTFLPNNLCTGICAAGTARLSFLILAYVYITARVARIVWPNIRLKMLGVGFLLYFCVCVFLSLPNLLKGVPSLNSGAAYHWPHVWAISILIVGAMASCRHIQLPAFFQKAIALVAPSMFGVYLLHEVTLVGHKWYLFPVNQLLACKLMPQPCTIIFSALIYFGGCLLFDIIVRRPLAALACKVSKVFFEYIDRRFVPGA